jgi:hypothetical protein
MHHMTVRISSRGKEILAQLSKEADLSMTDILDRALESYRRQQFLEKASAAYSSLSGESAAEYRHEMASLDTVAGDGLEAFVP